MGAAIPVTIAANTQQKQLAIGSSGIIRDYRGKGGFKRMLTIHGKPEWLNRKQSANYLTSVGCPITAKTLANMAANNNKGKGPSYTRFRWGRVRYLKSDLDMWRQQEAVRVE